MGKSQFTIHRNGAAFGVPGLDFWDVFPTREAAQGYIDKHCKDIAHYTIKETHIDNKNFVYRDADGNKITH